MHAQGTLSDGSYEQPYAAGSVCTWVLAQDAAPITLVVCPPKGLAVATTAHPRCNTARNDPMRTRSGTQVFTALDLELGHDFVKVY